MKDHSLEVIAFIGWCHCISDSRPEHHTTFPSPECFALTYVLMPHRSARYELGALRASHLDITLVLVT